MEQKAYQDQFAKVTQLESSEKGKDAQVQEGILGTSLCDRFLSY